MKEIRYIVELAVPARHSGLTIKQTAAIERVQRVALNTILSYCNTGKCDMSYNMAFVKLKSRHSDMFPPSIQPNTRNKTMYSEYTPKNWKVLYITTELPDCCIIGQWVLSCASCFVHFWYT